MAFPATPLAMTVELYLGPSLGWVDITSDVRQSSAGSGGGVSIGTRGRSSPGRDPDVVRCNLVVNNAGGKYSPRNPASPYYGLLTRNTPLRVRVADVDPGGALAVDGWRRNSGTPGAAVTAPHTSLNGTGDVDVRVWLRMDAWTFHGGIFVVGKDDSWSLAIGDTGMLEWRWVDGSSGAHAIAQSVKPAPAADGSLAIRATLTVSDGSVRFYSAPTLAGPWTQLGGAFIAGATSVKASATNGVQVGRVASYGDNAVTGELFGMELRSGGTLVASPDFTTLRAGATSLTDAQGRVWTFDPGAVPIDRGARFHGEVSEWPLKWNLAGTDTWVPLEASGIRRRLGQGNSPVVSPLRRTVAGVNPAAYLPLEDGAAATRPTSAAAGVATGTSSGVTFGNDPGPHLPGTASVAKMTTATATLSTAVAQRSGASTWSLLLFFKLNAMPVGSDVVYARVYFTGGRVTRWDFMLSGGGYRWIGYDSTGVVVDDRSFSNTSVPPNDWVIHYIEWSTSGSSVSWQPWMANAVDGTFFVGGPYLYTGAVGQPTRVDVVGSSYFQDALLGHLAVAPQRILYAGDFAAVASGYSGEKAGERIARVCAEEGLPVTWWGFPHDTTPAGPQPIAPLLDILADAAKTDGGLLLEGRGHLGLHYRTRASLYNQTPIPVDYTDLVQLEYTDDDELTRNDVTVSRPDGGSARAVQTSGPLSVLNPPDGVGTYDTSEKVNVATDSQLIDHAGWRLHLGTVDEARYPKVKFNLASPALAADAATTKAVVLADAGDVASIAGLPAWLPPGPARVMVDGYAETLDKFEWSITWNGSPASAWDIATWSGSARMVANGTTLTAAITAGATSFQITSTAANGAWTTDPTQFPLDLKVGAERVTVSAISGTGLTQTVTVTARAVNGVSKAWPVGTSVDVWEPAVFAL
ncbi:hypothetical protein [Micromonospora globispora]|uniref:hypothetical protein n=1 Tax=Micromonospora globispora TaxID=1450148 RepID=UPI000F5F62DA|nr:hypothetical protein [Micromonospora globispora]